MRKLSLFLAAVGFVACGGNSGGSSICDMPETRPDECDIECDPAGTNTCPAGFYCNSGTCDAQCTATGGECGEGRFCSPDGRCFDDGACVGLECNIVDCGAIGMPTTTISGTVYAPNGTLPLYGISVYIPNADPGPLQEGAICERCGQRPGSPVAETLTDEAGNFVLSNVPAGADIPVVIVSGKWRRQITIPMVPQCTDTALQTAQTRLPKNSSEGDMPRIALSTGSADALECLIRKLGIEDSEISTAGQPGRVHLFTNDGTAGQGAADFENGFPGGSGNFADSKTMLWDSVDHLKAYDIVILSCEGRQDPNSKPQSAMNAMQAYADLGGRIFASHWHNIWIGGEDGDPSHGIADWQPVGEFCYEPGAPGDCDNPNPSSLAATIDEVDNPKGGSFATWMMNVMGTVVRGLIDPVTQSRTTCKSIDDDLAERWVYLDPVTSPGESSVMNFQFTTPQDADLDQRCGKVVFSDMHVSADSDSNDDTPFPQDCATGDLTPQEKALAFMFFDLASCVSTVPIE